MARYKLLIEYDGRPFLGWQTQSNGMGIQDKLEGALRELFKEPIRVFCAGRTDTGVHASGQVVHCDLETDMNEHRLREGINYYLKPHPIAVLEAYQMDYEFHARFDAVERHYRYKILNRRATATYRDGLVWHVRKELCLESMKEAAQDFLGTHDFTTFRATDCQSPSPVRTMNKIFFEHYQDEIHFCVHAKSFLQHQIRSMVGTLVKIGLKQYPIDYIEKALLEKDRRACGPVAPPHGLYFEKVVY